MAAAAAASRAALRATTLPKRVRDYMVKAEGDRPPGDDITADAEQDFRDFDIRRIVGWARLFSQPPGRTLIKTVDLDYP